MHIIRLWATSPWPRESINFCNHDAIARTTHSSASGIRRRRSSIVCVRDPIASVPSELGTAAYRNGCKGYAVPSQSVADYLTITLRTVRGEVYYDLATLKRNRSKTLFFLLKSEHQMRRRMDRKSLAIANLTASVGKPFQTHLSDITQSLAHCAILLA